MIRTRHFHILDIGEGDWGAHPDIKSARRAILKILEDFNPFFDPPMTKDEFTIISSDEWCGLNDEVCEYDRSRAIWESLRQEPEWTHTFEPEPKTVYRIDGKRVPRWKMACSMPIDRATELWPFTGHPVALHQWRYDTIIMNPELCTCKGRGHRKKGCIIGRKGRKCQICGALYEDYGNSLNYCLPCDDWRDQRERYLADWAADRMGNATAVRQLALL